jgi:hypothetical protein
MQSSALLFAFVSFLCKTVVEALFCTSMDEKVQKDLIRGWDKCYQELILFRMNHGHCSPSRKYIGNHVQRLGRWVMSQRIAFRSGRLEKTRVYRLDALEFVWSPRTELWNQMLMHLKRFVQENGHCNFSPTDDSRLSRWISTQRFRQKSFCKLFMSSGYPVQCVVVDYQNLSLRLLTVADDRTGAQEGS